MLWIYRANPLLILLSHNFHIFTWFLTFPWKSRIARLFRSLKIIPCLDECSGLKLHLYSLRSRVLLTRILRHAWHGFWILTRILCVTDWHNIWFLTLFVLANRYLQLVNSPNKRLTSILPSPVTQWLGKLPLVFIFIIWGFVFAIPTSGLFQSKVSLAPLSAEVIVILILVK